MSQLCFLQNDYFKGLQNCYYFLISDIFPLFNSSKSMATKKICKDYNNVACNLIIIVKDNCFWIKMLMSANAIFAWFLFILNSFRLRYYFCTAYCETYVKDFRKVGPKNLPKTRNKRAHSCKDLFCF